jgi:hypothetical protein
VRPLAPSPAWTLVTPYCKRTQPGRGTNTKAAGFPPPSLSGCLFPPSRSVSRRPIWAGARGDISLVGPGTPRSRNADTVVHLGFDGNWTSSPHTQPNGHRRRQENPPPHAKRYRYLCNVVHCIKNLACGSLVDASPGLSVKSLKV